MEGEDAEVESDPGIARRSLPGAQESFPGLVALACRGERHAPGLERPGLFRLKPGQVVVGLRQLLRGSLGARRREAFPQGGSGLCFPARALEASRQRRPGGEHPGIALQEPAGESDRFVVLAGVEELEQPAEVLERLDPVLGVRKRLAGRGR